MKKNGLEAKGKVQETEGEDVDIMQLFTFIGKGITNLINFIISLFQTVFGWFLLFLLFIRANLNKMILAAVVGGSLGAIYQYAIKEVQYESSMTVEPNFGSAVQL